MTSTPPSNLRSLLMERFWRSVTLEAGLYRPDMLASMVIF